MSELVGWPVRWLVSLFAKQISTPIQLAATIEGMASASVSVNGWLGVRFDVTNAACPARVISLLTRRFKSPRTSTSGVTFTGLWAPHNGHRLLVPGLLFFLRDTMLWEGPSSAF